MRITEVLFALLDFELTGKALSEEVINSINSAVTEDLIKIAKTHDLTHLLADALKKIDKFPTGEQGEKLKKSKKVAILRSEVIKADTEKISGIFNEAKIPFIKLKGARVREYYPEDFMRTSCDIDVLVHEEALDSAIEALKNAGWSVHGKKHFHDISLYSKNGTHLELHFNIKGGNGLAYNLLERVWEYAILKEEGKSEYIQTQEYFLFHLVSHIATHFFSSGCGIKYFLDIYLLGKRLKFDEEKLQSLLRQADLEEFYKKVLDLKDVWFNERKHDKITYEMELFILTGGVYGSRENRIKNTQAKAGGKLRHIKNRIFMPYKSLKTRYKILEKHKYLTPVFQVVRWSGMLFRGKVKRSIKELHSISSVKKKEFETNKDLLKSLGLLK